jgi:glycerol-3-phosphate acyltransferase PlsY
MNVFGLTLLGAYLLGGIPFGVLVARMQGIDITQVGSGNIGATNVVRALGPRWGTVTFVLDMLKGLIPSLVARQLFTAPLMGLDPQALWFICGLVAVIGHAKSPFLKFKGGKGVSTALGAGLGSAPLVALGAFVVFAIVLGTIRYMAVASMVAVCSAVLFAMILPGQSLQVVPLFFLLAALVVFLHHKNIARLRAGTEPKFAFRKSSEQASAASSQDESPMASHKE